MCGSNSSGSPSSEAFEKAAEAVSRSLMRYIFLSPSLMSTSLSEFDDLRGVVLRESSDESDDSADSEHSSDDDTASADSDGGSDSDESDGA